MPKLTKKAECKECNTTITPQESAVNCDCGMITLENGKIYLKTGGRLTRLDKKPLFYRPPEG